MIKKVINASLSHYQCLQCVTSASTQ